MAPAGIHLAASRIVYWHDGFHAYDAMREMRFEMIASHLISIVSAHFPVISCASRRSLGRMIYFAGSADEYASLLDYFKRYDEAGFAAISAQRPPHSCELAMLELKSIMAQHTSSNEPSSLRRCLTETGVLMAICMPFIRD